MVSPSLLHYDTMILPEYGWIYLRFCGLFWFRMVLPFWAKPRASRGRFGLWSHRLCGWRFLVAWAKSDLEWWCFYAGTNSPNGRMTTAIFHGEFAQITQPKSDQSSNFGFQTKKFEQLPCLSMAVVSNLPVKTNRIKESQCWIKVQECWRILGYFFLARQDQSSNRHPGGGLIPNQTVDCFNQTTQLSQNQAHRESHHPTSGSSQIRI